MNSNPKLSYAIAAILSGSGVGWVHAATATTDTDPDAIQEITVTATRRTENMQDVPIFIQALTGETLKQLNVSTLDDFIKYTPNVSQLSTGPGQGSVYMRGLSVGATGQQGTGSVGPFPNVSVYLDDVSAALPGRNLDVYAADLDHIEVLEGPQGTLFGSGAQAGVLRYITNKPKLDTTEGAVNAGYSYTAGGDPNSNVDAMINLPLIPNTLAVRAVVYDDARGGYINNVPATFTRSSTDLGFGGKEGFLLPPDNPSINNNSLVQNAFNPVTYQGVRLEALLKINDDWNVLLTQSYQQMHSEGVFYQNPYAPDGETFDKNGQPVGHVPLPKDSAATFEPSFDNDKFENTSLTVNGQIGDLKLVYNGGYLIRTVHQQQDYTNYSRGVFGSYYQCSGLSKTVSSGTCYSPEAVWQENEKTTHLSHEFRVTTPDDARIRGIGGIYWEEFKVYDHTDWTYRSVPTCSPTIDVNCFNNTAPRPGEVAIQGGEQPDGVGFADDVTRTVIQKAAFGSVDVDIIPKTLIFTAGTRYYDFHEHEVGGDFGSFYCKVFTPTTYYGPCTAATNGAAAPYGSNVGAANYSTKTYAGFRSRADLSWHVNKDVLVYYTWSQGFRPGGFNRNESAVQKVGGVAEYITPGTYAPDTLTNNEIGFKTEFLDHRLQVNGAIYQEDWKNTIVEFFDPAQGFGNLTFVTNGPQYRVRGGELQVVARATEGLTIQGSASYNKSVETNSPLLVGDNPASPTFGKPLTNIPNVYGITGSPLGESPLFQGNLRVRYEFPLADYKAFTQASAQYYGGSWSEVGTVGNYYMGGYATFDAAAGISKDKWNVQLFAQNLADKNASTYTNTWQIIETQTIIRPRIAGVKFGYKF